ncbi:MAG: hypothetical protein RMJ07_00570 [Nitrososphaerota archaeon]|nr:hypothetical protein [Candidatus Bathyarchaeota archaeon]MDW8048166.1 hypothetical protein [Nitrososphaerota archaeon]
MKEDSAVRDPGGEESRRKPILSIGREAKNRKEGRKLLAARLSLANKISEIAARRGTLYDYVNDVLEQAVRADNLGLSLKELLDDRWLMKEAKDAGLTVFPQSILYKLVERAYGEVGEEWMEKLWYETGQWYGRYFEDLSAFQSAVKKFFWDVSEFKIAENEQSMHLTCLSSRFSDAYTRLFSRFIDGVLNALGYTVTESDVTKGIINMKFRRGRVKQ